MTTDDKSNDAPRGAADAPPSFVVGIGASAGGFEAFTQLFEGLAPDTSMAFVVIQHLDPVHPSLLTAGLRKVTQMPVVEIRDKTPVIADHVYVIPPGFDVEIRDGHLLLSPRDLDGRTPHLPIDTFFSALAIDLETRAIGVVLSGSANDGTEGLRAIRDAGGATFVQTPAEAKYPSMPTSAIEAGVADVVVSISTLGAELARLAKRGPSSNPVALPYSEPADQRAFARVLELLQKREGVNFSEYKSATIRRRLARRLSTLRIETLEKYVDHLAIEPNEAHRLAEDVLIHVTSFFRDQEAFRKLQEGIFPQILRAKPAGASLRIWVAGCSTGEEVFSIAIALLELVANTQPVPPIQIFGSDISERMIERARTGLFPASAFADMPPERLKRFFDSVDDSYRIKKFVRDLCVFVRHDLARDPPFSRLDLISCRNVLIYFDHPLQRRILTTFHYCLNEPGYLVLGRTENVSSQQQLYFVEDKVNKIFSRTSLPSRLTFLADSPNTERKPLLMARALPDEADDSHSVDAVLLSDYAPCGVLVDDRLEVLQYRGQTSRYLEQPSGKPQTNLLKKLRAGIFVELQLALAEAKLTRMPVRRPGLGLHEGERIHNCDLVVHSIGRDLTGPSARYLVLFCAATGAASETTAPPPLDAADQSRSAGLERELASLKSYLQAQAAEYQKSADELAAANAEFVSGNEELQSMNEELETAKEELQSTNEELTTVNDELQTRSLEVGHANNDLVNLLNSVEIPIVILDTKRRIRRFTPHARHMMNLLPSDVGRLINDIRPKVSIDNLDREIRLVLETAASRESEVQDDSGRWHRIQIRPYKTLDDKIDGVVLSLVDINSLRRAVHNAEWARDYATSVVEAIATPLLVLSVECRALSANRAFYATLGLKQSEIDGKSLDELGMGAWKPPGLPESLGTTLGKHELFTDIEIERELPGLGLRTLSLSARSIRPEGDLPEMILLAIEDITLRRKIELEHDELLRRAQDAKAEADRANRSKDDFLATLSHELRTPLTSLILQAHILRHGGLTDDEVRRAGDLIDSSAKAQAQLIEDLLDISRIVTGKLKMDELRVDCSEVIRSAIETVANFAKSREITIEGPSERLGRRVLGDPTRLKQVVWNLLTNAIKFSPAGGRVVVTLKTVGNEAQICVIDHGAGIEAGFLPDIFQRFSQAEGTITRSQGGLGLGLAIVHNIVERHGGHVHVHSDGKDRGSTFTVQLPLLPATPSPSARRPTASGNASSGTGDSEARAELVGCRILLVDDDANIRESLARLLERSGAAVRMASSAGEGMRILREFKPDELICDIAMPNEDGYTFMHKVRDLPRDEGGAVRAIALTALATEHDLKKAMSAGFQRHVAKPFDYTVLTDTLIDLRHATL